MKSFKFTSFGVEYYFDTLDELEAYVNENNIATNLDLYERESNSNTYRSIGEISEWIK